jgi:hypothetical protein
LHSKISRLALSLGTLTASVVLCSTRAQAIPIFAQRYHLTCETCHSVLPELNAFGVSFREHGYQLPLPKHGTTVVALRYQLEYEQNPVNQRRFTPGGIILGNLEVGHITAFAHYNLGAQGGPAGLYLGYLAGYNEHTQTLYRAGLFELPLLQSPGQRLDDLQQYGYYGIHVGLNDLALSQPRWGFQIERTFDKLRLDFIGDDGEFKGAAYGGAPAPTGETTSASHPEFGLFAHVRMTDQLSVGGEAMTGSRRIVLTGKSGFEDPYTRDGVYLQYAPGKFELTGEQWWGSDQNADGVGTQVASSGGYARAKYYTTPHSYLAIRYDASANPFITRDWVYYGAFMILPQVRFIVQQVQTVGSSSSLGAAITIGCCGPLKY